jgi:hypothetical protein
MLKIIISAHLFLKFLEAVLKVSTSVAQAYEQVQAACSYDNAIMQSITRMALQAVFLEADLKADLMAQV